MENRVACLFEERRRIECCALLKRVCNDNRFARGEFKLEEGKGKREELAYLHPHV